jgi:hypothetical protein
MNQGTKRSRSQQQDAGHAEPDLQAEPDLPGREQLTFVSDELQTRLGQKYCDEADLLQLMLAHKLIRRVRTIAVEVRPLGGDSFKVSLDAAKPTVGEAKAEISRVQGTKTDRQELYRVAVREDGTAVREDDAEPELLDDASMPLEEGAVVTMTVEDDDAEYEGDDAKECFDCTSKFKRNGPNGSQCECENWVCSKCTDKCAECEESFCRDCPKASCGHCCENCAEICAPQFGGCEKGFCKDCLDYTNCGVNGQGCNRRSADVSYCEECRDHSCK